MKIYGTFPDIYVITPFKSVSGKLNEKIKKGFAEISELDVSEIHKWAETHCGTIHTFQGKEADEVLLVLGCDKQSKKAMEWVGRKPNIINVAVSRAKYRLGVIGDCDLWKKIKYIDVVCRSIKPIGIKKLKVNVKKPK